MGGALCTVGPGRSDRPVSHVGPVLSDRLVSHVGPVLLDRLVSHVGPVLSDRLVSHVGPVLSDRLVRSKGKGQRSKVRYQGLGRGIKPDVGVRVTRRRKSVGVVLLACGALAWSGSMMLAQDDARHANRSMPAGSTLSMVIDKYCAGCHHDTLRSASGLLLEKFDLARIDSSPELWAKAYRQMQAGAMLSVGSPWPDRATTARRSSRSSA